MSSPSRRAMARTAAAAAAAGAGSPAASPARSRTTAAALASRGNAAAAAASPPRSRSSMGRRESAQKQPRSVVVQQQLPSDIAQQWDGEKNKLLRPQHISPASVRMIHWRCRACDASFRRRVRDHMALQGQCPHCLTVVAATATETSSSPRKEASAAILTNTASSRESFDALPAHQKDRRLLAPMLAYSWDQHEAKYADTDKFFVSRKLDGVRCIAAFDPILRQPYFLSRVGNQFECADWISEALYPAFERDPSLVLDGELYDHDVDDFSNLIGSIKVTRSKRTAQHEAMQQALQFHAFDVMYAKGVDATTPFASRLGALERILTQLPTTASKRVRFVENEIYKKRDIEDVLDRAIDKRYEGVMLRVPSGTYDYGKRSVSLLKAKRMHDAEYKVVDVLEGKGRFFGGVGSVVCETPDGEHRFKAGFGVPDDLRKTLWETRETALVGNMATIQYQQLTPRGVPRFGQFKCIRSDASGTNFV